MLGKVLVTQLCLTLYSPMDCSPPGPSVHGVSQARILEWVAISFSRGIFLTQGLNPDLLLCRQILYHLSHQGSPEHAWENPILVQFSSITQSCPTLCNPMDYSSPGSSVYGISQARILEWVAISFSRGLLYPGIEPPSPALAGGFFTH